MTASAPIHILLVDDHTLFRDSVARLLAGEPDFAVVGACATSSEALRVVSRATIDVLLLDFDLGRRTAPNCSTGCTGPASRGGSWSSPRGSRPRRRPSSYAAASPASS
jgi:DNA-binding NarL/FixJ family response regulator